MKIMRLLFVALFVFSGLAGVAHAAVGDEGKAASMTEMRLPSGANSMQETFVDWQVACTVQGGTRVCTLSQQQYEKRSKKRVLAVEFAEFEGDSVKGALILPFGLLLDDGINLRVDDKGAKTKLRYRTCLPAGCLVTLDFDKKMMAAMRKGDVLEIEAVGDEGAVPFKVSLSGFSKALARVKMLNKYRHKK